MTEEKLRLRKDFEFARDWLEKLNYFSDLAVNAGHLIWFASDPYPALCSHESKESKLLLELYRKGKDLTRDLPIILQAYDQLGEFDTLKDYVNYLEMTLEQHFKIPLEDAFKKLKIPIKHDFSDAALPSLEEAEQIRKDLDGEQTYAEYHYGICRSNIITDSRDLLETIEDILKWCKSIKKSNLPGLADATEDARPDLPTHYITCVEIAGIIGKRSDVVAQALKAHHYTVIKKAKKNYCDPAHAAVIWHKYKKHLKKKSGLL